MQTITATNTERLYFFRDSLLNPEEVQPLLVFKLDASVNMDGEKTIEINGTLSLLSARYAIIDFDATLLANGRDWNLHIDDTYIEIVRIKPPAE